MVPLASKSNQATMGGGGEGGDEPWNTDRGAKAEPDASPGGRERDSGPLRLNSREARRLAKIQQNNLRAEADRDFSRAVASACADGVLSGLERKELLLKSAGALVKAHNVGNWVGRGKVRHRRGEARKPIEKKSLEQAVYIIGSGDGPIKIGIAMDVEDRVAVLQTGHPHRLYVVRAYRFGAGIARKVERYCHEELSRHRCNGEWFDIPKETAIAVVERFASYFKGEREL